jgi:hypothetical protein
MTRFALLRKGAFPSFLPARKATRPCWPRRSLVGFTKAIMLLVFTLCACEKKLVISALDLMVPFTALTSLLCGSL